MCFKVSSFLHRFGRTRGRHHVKNRRGRCLLRCFCSGPLALFDCFCLAGLFCSLTIKNLDIRSKRSEVRAQYTFLLSLRHLDFLRKLFSRTGSGSVRENNFLKKSSFAARKQESSASCSAPWIRSILDVCGLHEAEAIIVQTINDFTSSPRRHQVKQRHKIGVEENAWLHIT